MYRAKTISPFGPQRLQTILQVSTSWWLAGGVSSSDCTGAWQAKGAASYSASKSNLANPGTYDISENGGAVNWDATNGWTSSDNGYYLSVSSIPYTQASSFIIKYSVTNTFWQFGNGTAGQFIYISPQSSGTTIWYAIGGSEGSCSVTGGTAGVACIANVNCYFAGSSVGTLSTPTNFSGSGLTRLTTYYVSGSTVQYAALYSTTLSATQVAAITTAMV